ncbi:hypothetical protein AK830_g8165 [Neonectria ditissima]|uniref:Uncharacterized protein n=1 Tax=Neonectria ditissima TaxID=78410 RepID=A0A0P7AV72_9HYPO|nr:hypothetical protein AK830_g8165 [Neonectria ditissima]
MPSEAARFLPLLALLLSLSLLTPRALAQIDPSSVLDARDDSSTASGDPLRVDLTYLPAQIGGIIGAYAVCLVLVAITLLALSKKRREHLLAGNDEIDFTVPKFIVPQNDFEAGAPAPPCLNLITKGPTIQNFSLPSPTHEFTTPNTYFQPSPTSTVGAPGVDPTVDQRIVAADRVMAQSQLEDMYKHVLEHEDAKKRGYVYEAPLPGVHHQPRASTSVASIQSTGTVLSKKERTKPAGLNLSATRDEEKTQSRTSSFLSALRSPRKKNVKGISISSPIMTPQSATFPRHESQEMNPIPPRQYAPAAPPPVPMDQAPFGAAHHRPYAPATPDISPESVMSIDERIGSQLPPVGQTHTRTTSLAPTEVDPQSATSEHSQAPLVGLPSSPKPGARFPTLPASPKPGQTFHRPNAPSAVRTGGSLPLRAYEPSVSTPTTIGRTTKQTVFERKGPLSPSGAMTPYTAGAVPYSPYQPFTPCLPMTPSLVTKEDRKRMKRMVPKTPTINMVQSTDDVW